MIDLTREIPMEERMTSYQAHTLREYYYTKGIGWGNAHKWLMLVTPHTTKKEASKEIQKQMWLKHHGRPTIPTDYDESLITD